MTLPLLLVGQACQEPDQEIFSTIPSDEVLNSEDPDVLAVLAASAYAQLAGTWGAHNSLWSMHEISSDEMAITQKGADWQDGGMWLRMHRHEWLPTEESINNGWNYVFDNVGNVNNLLKNFNENEILNAELSVVRALLYYWLLDAYGSVPIIEEDDTNPTPVNNTPQEVFNFIESEVQAALPFLQQNSTYATVNYYVAQTLLAKLYLNAETYIGTPRYADAAAAALEVIDGNAYSLEPDFFENFTEQNQGSSENIFVINYDKDNAQGFNLAQMTLHYLSQETYRLQEQPWNGYSSLEEFYNSFDEEDLRRGSFIVGPQFSAAGERLLDNSAEATDPDGPPLTFTPEINMLAPNAWRQAGARVGKWEYAFGSPNSLSNDFPIFRYSDVLLMRAEALWRQSPGSTEAVDLVNQVRDRAGLDPVSSINADFLLAERGREMFAEGWRRQDQIRFGDFFGSWWEKNPSPQFRKFFPIPQAAIDANTNLIQNDGY
jgi:hypothetical protein